MRSRDDCPQSIDGRLLKQDVVGGVDIYHQIPNLAEGGIELNIPSGVHSLTRETDHLIIVRLHLLLDNPHPLFSRRCPSNFPDPPTFS